MSFDTDFSAGGLEPSEEKTVELVAFGNRLGAYLIDGFIISIIIFSVVCGLVFVFSNANASLGMMNALNCLGIILGAAYTIVFWGLKDGQTPGKMALGIKVIKQDGTSLSWGDAILRYVGYIINNVIFGLGFLWAAFDEKNQGLHDKIAKTYVVPKDTQFSNTDDVNFVQEDAGQGWVWIVLAAIILIAIPCVIIAILLLLGPVIGDVFSGIVSELEAPVGP